MTPWTVAHQAPLSMGFPRREYWSGLTFPPPGDLPNSGMEPASPALADGFTELPGKPLVKMLCRATQSGLSLCYPMGCSLPGFSVPGDSPRKNSGVGCHALLQGIFPTQGLNPGPLHYRQILYHLSHREALLDGCN